MLFTDPLFLFFFLPLFLFGMAALTRACGGAFRNPLKLYILIATLVFYGWRHKPAWWVPFCLAVAFDFLWSRLLVETANPRVRRALLTLSITQNVSLLFVYKYLAWVLGFELLDGLPGVDLLRHAWLDAAGHSRVEMPAGISFYLFESMSYVIDVYRGVVVPPRNPLDFFSFIAMFPRMIAGPIVRYAQVVDQMADWAGTRLQHGLPLFMLGFVYKALWADSFAVFVPYAFGPEPPAFAAAWFGTICYSFQLYFDFAGYSLMAIGLGHGLGFRFPTNFKDPYVADSIVDFWRRWHISLSTWLRDYLYIPLGGNRCSHLRRDLNLIITMALGGLWHGSNATFLVWGLLHGVYLFAERETESLRAAWPNALRRAVTLLLVLVGWTVFRADGLGQAGRVLRAMAGLDGFQAGSPDLLLHHGFAAFWLPPAAAYALFLGPRWTAPEDRASWSRGAEALISVLFVLAVGTTLTTRLVPFLYFQF
jgi:alginate O-acetyltransferase complex protein AlgI